MPGPAGRCQAGRGIGWLALAHRKGDAGTRQANAAGRSPPGPAESGTHRQSPRLRHADPVPIAAGQAHRPAATRRSSPGSRACLQQAGPGAPGRGGVSRSHQPHQPLMQHSIGGGAPWPGLVIGAAVYPKIPQQIQITGQQARILQGQLSDQRRGPALPGDQRPPPAPRCRGWPPPARLRRQPARSSRLSPWNCARAAPHLRAGDRAAPQGPRSSHSQRRHTASEPAPPAPQLGPQHQPTARPDSPTRLPIPELEHMCTAVRAGNTTASRADSAICRRTGPRDGSH